MDTANFLARVVPPGNYFAVTTMWQKPGNSRPFAAVRMFKDAHDAARYASWANGKGNDVYHSQASFKIAEAKQGAAGYTHYEGSKDASNVALSRALYLDMDALRPGDKKVAGVNAYATKKDALTWLLMTVKALGLPHPSLLVDSGWGIHPYWLLMQALPQAQWELLANALKACALANGFVGDAGIIGDVARILRTPGSVNRKDPANPKPVKVIHAGPDIDNAIMMKALNSWIGLQTTAASSAVAGGGTISPLLQGQKSAAFVTVNTSGVSMAAAAQANVPAGPAHMNVPTSMARIAAACGQVGGSLAAAGAGDSYPLWNDLLLLSSFTADGGPDGWAHKLSSGHPSYTQAGVDAQVAQIAKERVKKPTLGPPTCARLGTHRPAACASCPFAGKISSPIVLGREQDLPDGYRRGPAGIDRREVDEDTGATHWEMILAGDITNFLVDDSGQGAQVMHFRYIHQQTHREVSFAVDELLAQGPKLRSFLARHAITTVVMEKAKQIEAFLMAWLEKIKQDNGVRTDKMPAFGWADQRGKIIGFAVAGTLYRKDGADEPTKTGDQMLLTHYREIGEYVNWRVACDIVANQRPDLAVIIATAFASPLVRCTNQSGCLISAVSRASGIGKSSAIKIAQAVWGDPTKGVNSLNDTTNAVVRRLSEIRHLPGYWDEMRAQGDGKEFVQLAFQLSMGKEKARLNSNAESREVSEWRTLLTVASNEPLIDYINDHVHNTEAGALRCFEWSYEGNAVTHIPGATQAINRVAYNYGSAGRIYARWLAKNSDVVERQVNSIYDKMFTKLGALNEERFYVSAITTLLVGAGYANLLNLTNFDIPAMQDFLFHTFHKLRRDRQGLSISSATGYNLEQILFDFAAQHQASRLITETFSHTTGLTNKILLNPISNRNAVIHIAANTKVMRINRTPFKEYLRTRKLPPSAIEEEMTATWGAKVAKEVFCAGTPWSTGRGWIIEVPLYLPNLAAGFLPARVI